jgi:hypothetical protein
VRFTKTLVIPGVMIAVLSAVWAYGQQYGSQQRTPAMLSPQDHLEIQQLYGYYTRDVDPYSVRDASWVYTPDGVFIYGGNGIPDKKVSGEKELKEFYTNLAKAQAFGTRHVNSNFLIVKTPEGAEATAYLTTVERKDPSKPAWLNQFGVYHDKLVKTPVGWRFKERHLVFDGPNGQPGATR